MADHDDANSFAAGSNHSRRRNKPNYNKTIRYDSMPEYFSSDDEGGDAPHSPAGPDTQRENPMVSSIEKLAQKRGLNRSSERFTVKPDYAYPHTKMNREELRKEMNKKSIYFHDLRLPSEPKGVGQVALEIMQCFGLPKPDSTLGSEASAFCIAVCGSHAFRTDTMPPVANPIWLQRMRRACLFPVFHAYARVYIGVFGQSSENRRDGFAGRIVVDLSQLRPHCTYDITLPLRQSAHVYARAQRGAMRIRIHLSWHSERDAILSYLPKKMPRIEPNEDVAVRCCDVKSFQNVARVVHGDHMPGRFHVKQLRATIKEIQLTQINVLRYMRKGEFRNLRQWRVPIISAFVFGAWMHCVYTESVTYVPGHLVTFLLLYLWKNYAYYRVQRSPQNGFIVPSWEEMFWAVVFGGSNNIAPLEMQAKDSFEKTVMDDIADANMSQAEKPTINEIARTFRSEMMLHTGRQHMRMFQQVFKGSEAVDFLLKKGYADSRDAAVALGKKLVAELKLFEGVMQTYEFLDEPLLYHFGNYDTNKYVVQSYKPKGRFLFRLFGFLPKTEPTYTESQMEMPFAGAKDHPRFTVKESLVIRSKESMRMMEDEHEESGNRENGKSDSQQLAAGMNALLGDNGDTPDATKPEESTRTLDDDPEKVDAGKVDAAKYDVKLLNKPPQQDILFKLKKRGKPIPEVMAEARDKCHRFLLHAFNDRVYPQNLEGLQRLSVLKKRKVGKGRLRRLLSKKSADSIGNAHDQETDPVKIRDDYDKLLKIGKYSSSNPWISRVSVIIQPIVEIALEVLCLFRAVFNLFTWRDPMLTFWVSVFGPIVVVVLHCFPWRIVMGIVGVVVFGPQNWILRLRRESLHGPDEFNPDRLVKKRKKPQEPADEEVPLFSMYAPDNQPISNDDIDTSVVRKVVVPYSPLMYQRFYDFPPETEYARVVADVPPTEEQLDSSRISSDRTVDGHLHEKRGMSFRGIRRRMRHGR